MFGPNSSRKHKKNIFKKIVWFILFAGILAGLVLLVVRKDTANPSADTMSQEEVKKLTKELSQFMVVPEEEPLIFTISDSDYLMKEQKFFENASNGDILFVFPETQKAVLYSPDKEKIINAGPVNFDTSDVR